MNSSMPTAASAAADAGASMPEKLIRCGIGLAQRIH